MTVVAPIDRLAAILRLDMPAAVNRSTSRILRMGNLAPGIAPLPVEKGGEATRIRGSPNGARPHSSPRSTAARDRPEQLLGITRNGCSGSIGMGARDQSESLLGITRYAQLTRGFIPIQDAVLSRGSGGSERSGTLRSQWMSAGRCHGRANYARRRGRQDVCE